MSELPCAALVLAAGGSLRLGAPKQLVRVGGDTLLRWTVSAALGSGCHPVLAVLGGHADACEPELAGLAVTNLVNSKWQTGIASSLRCGIEYLLTHQPGTENLLVLVCDQPALDGAFLSELIQVHLRHAAPVTCSLYGGIYGVPAIFSAALFPQLIQLQGDQGARFLIRRYGQSVQALSFLGGEFDIDTPEDLARFRGTAGPPGAY